MRITKKLTAIKILSVSLCMVAAALFAIRAVTVPASPPTVAEWVIDRIGEPTYQENQVSTAAISPDGRLIASSAGIALRLWDAGTGEPIGKPMLKNNAEIGAIAWSPDGRYIATGSYDDFLVLWDVQNHNALWSIPASHEQVLAIAFSPDSKHIATGGKNDHAIRIWDRENGHAIGEPLIGHGSDITALTFADGGNVLISTGLDGTIRIWDAKSHASLRAAIQTGFQNGPRQLALHPLQSIVAVTDHDSISFWNYKSGDAAGKTLTGYSATYGFSGIAFNKDGSQLFSADSFGTMSTIDWKNGKSIARGLTQHNDVIVYQTAFAPSGNLIATASKDNSLGIWHASVSKEPRSFAITEVNRQPNPYGGAHPTISTTGRYIAYSQGEQLKIVDRKSNTLIFDENLEGIASLPAFSPDDQWIAFGNIILNLSSMERVPIRLLVKPFGRVMLVFSHDSKHLAMSVVKFESGHTSNRFYSLTYLLETDSGKVLRDYKYEIVQSGTSGEVSSLAFSPDDQVLLAATHRGDVTRFGTSTMKPLGEIWHGLGNLAIFSPDGGRIAAARYDRAVIVDAKSGAQLTNPMDPNIADGSITSLAFTADGKFLAIAASDQVVTLWDSTTGQRLGRKIVQFAPDMRDLQLSPDARHIFATSGANSSGQLPYLLVESEVAIHSSALKSLAAPIVKPSATTVSSDIAAKLDGFMPLNAAFDPRAEQIVTSRENVLVFLNGNEVRDAAEEFPAAEAITPPSESPTSSEESEQEDSQESESKPEPPTIHYVAVSRDGRFASAAPDGGEMRVFDVATGQRVSIIRDSGYGPNNYVANGYGPHTFLANSQLALTSDRGVRLFDPESGAPLSSKQYPLDGFPSTIAAANQSQRIALGTSEGMLVLTSSDDSTLTTNIERAHHGSIYAITFSPNDQTVATGGVQGKVKLFDATSGRSVAGPWQVSTRPITTMAFSDDGKYLALGCSDGTFRVWDVLAGKPVTYALIGHTAPILAIRFDAASKQWLSFSGDGTLRRWHIGM